MAWLILAIIFFAIGLYAQSREQNSRRSARSNRDPLKIRPK